jgi:hypothetical protein
MTQMRRQSVAALMTRLRRQRVAALMTRMFRQCVAVLGNLARSPTSTVPNAMRYVAYALIGHSMAGAMLSEASIPCWRRP